MHHYSNLTYYPDRKRGALLHGLNLWFMYHPDKKFKRDTEERGGAMRYLVVRGRVVMGVCLLAVTICAALMFGTVHIVRTAGTAGKKYPIYSVETNKQLVSMGINCAWDNADIPALIEILGKYNIKATFFVVGDWCDKYPESVRMLYEAGHEIGSHSDTHADMTRLDRTGMQREIRNSATKIEALTGTRPILFRPPSGAYNSEVVQVIEDEGFYPIQWDCDSIDYKDPTADQMKARILKKLRSGSIMLFHSGAKNTPGALPRIIEAVQEKGYRFVPVSDLIYKGSYTVDFEGRQHSNSIP